MKDSLGHRPLITTVFVVAIAGSPTLNPAFAQTQTGTPTPPPSQTEPSASLAEGDRLRDSGDLPGALRIYRAVQTKQPSLEGQQRIAGAEDKLGQHGTAYVEYALLLDRYGTTLEPARKRAIESRLRELDELTGMLSLEPLMPNAVVRIDGRKVDDSLLSRPIRVTRGERRITVEQPGYRAVTLTQSVGATMAKVTLPLDPLPVTATLNVSSLSSAEVDLYLDGKKVGPLPQHLQLSLGEHVLHADGPKVYAEPRKVQLTSAASHQDLTLNLLEKPATLSIDPVAPDTVLYVDAKPLGTGLRNVELPPGRHSLELRRPGFRTQKLVLEVQAGQRNSLRAAPYVAESIAVKPVTPPPQPLTVEKPPPAEKSAKPAEQEQPPLPRIPEAEEEESRFSGFYGALIVPVMLGGDSTHSYTNHCPADTYSGACTTTAPRGGGLGLRMGYVYEWIGLELFAAGAVDVSTSELKLPPLDTIPQEVQTVAGKNVFVRAGGLLGGGVRFSTPIQGIRVTLGADYVYVARKVLAIPDSFMGASLGYSVPGYFIDGGIQLGSTPGARFYLGAFLFIENAHNLVLNRNLESLTGTSVTIPQELKTMTVYQGRQYFFGPLLGIAFGH
jgi:hypothetical protein